MAELNTDARVTPQEVKEIIATALTDPVLNACINTAHAIIDANLTAMGSASALLTEIELWLSAHFVAIREPKAKQKSVAGEYSVTYEKGDPGTGFSATTWGQQALALDFTGTLASMGLKKAKIESV